MGSRGFGGGGFSVLFIFVSMGMNAYRYLDVERLLQRKSITDIDIDLDKIMIDYIDRSIKPIQSTYSPPPKTPPPMFDKHEKTKRKEGKKRKESRKEKRKPKKL